MFVFKCIKIELALSDWNLHYRSYRAVTSVRMSQIRLDPSVRRITLTLGPENLALLRCAPILELNLMIYSGTYHWASLPVVDKVIGSIFMYSGYFYWHMRQRKSSRGSTPRHLKKQKITTSAVGLPEWAETKTTEHTSNAACHLQPVMT